MQLQFKMMNDFKLSDIFWYFLSSDVLKKIYLLKENVDITVYFKNCTETKCFCLMQTKTNWYF